MIAVITMPNVRIKALVVDARIEINIAGVNIGLKSVAVKFRSMCNTRLTDVKRRLNRYEK